MKKHLIAAAVAGALAVPAMAQVTVYGSIESGIASIKGGSGVVGATVAVDSVVNTSKLGFKGEEDLGGGLKAGFRLETRLDPNIGDVDEKSGTAAGSNFFERGAEIYLEGGFGKVQIGKLDHQGGENNETSYSGNLALFSGVEIGTDADNTISYTTPAFGGVKLNVTHSLADNANSNAQATAGTSGLTTAASINTAHDGITTYQLSGSVAGLAFKAGGGESKSTAGAKTKVMGLSAGYDFGAAKVSLGYQSEDVPDSTADESYSVLNVVAPISGALAAHVVYGQYDIKASTTSDFTVTGVGAAYAFSKRTTLYGIYRSTDYGSGGSATKNETILTINHSF